METNEDLPNLTIHKHLISPESKTTNVSSTFISSYLGTARRLEVGNEIITILWLLKASENHFGTLRIGIDARKLRREMVRNTELRGNKQGSNLSNSTQDFPRIHQTKECSAFHLKPPKIQCRVR